MMNSRTILCLCTVFVCIIAITVPLVGAATITTPQAGEHGYLARDNPELISSLKLHVAYLGETQQARMDGVIRYIDSISAGKGTYNLQIIEEDYMTTASSIPFMHTADEIDAAREDLQVQTRLFSEETKAQMVMFNGSTDAMRGSIGASTQAVEASFTNMRDSLWLARDTARLTVFNTYSQKRDELIAGLSAQGVDTSIAQKIADQIDAERSDLKTALFTKHEGAIQNVNIGLKDLNRQFRDIIQGYRTDRKIQVDKSAIMAIPD